jgi:pyruvate/2-oxoglutarate dehydrogenase complex dihydrolipoamide acyltransferase (E2) component
MPTPVYCPRTSANADTVKVTTVLLRLGQQVAAGDALFEVESAKALEVVEAERAGYVVGILGERGQEVACGAVLAWLGDAPTETPPNANVQAPTAKGAEPPTLRALELLRRHGLRAAEVPVVGSRLTAADVEGYVAARGPRPAAPHEAAASAPGSERTAAVPLSPMLRAMADQVQWHRESPVPAYCEIVYDPQPWETYAQEIARRERLMLSPLLPLMAFRLVGLAKLTPALNAYTDGRSLLQYRAVDLGFTVAAGGGLYLVVVRAAERLTELDFVRRLTELQRAAHRNRLKTEEVTGATVAFSSLAKFRVSRHVPVLPPQTALIVAHSLFDSGPAGARRVEGVLGATYDHRIVDGAQVARLLQQLATPVAVPMAATPDEPCAD